jgi:hypothetical protein
MDSIDRRLVPVYAVLLGLVALGACLASTEGSGHSVWDDGGAASVVAIVLLALLLWAAVIPPRTAWPLLTLAAGGIIGLIAMTADRPDEGMGAGSELLATAAGLAAATAIAQLGLLPRSPESAGGGNGS